MLAWHVRALGGRRGLHPRILKTVIGSGLVWLIGIGGVLLGGRGLAAEFGIAGPVGLGVVAAAGLLALAGGAGQRKLTAELAAAVGKYRADYASLDDEALYRFVVAERYPHLNRRQIEELTVDCGGIDDLARRLRPFESAIRGQQPR